MRATLRLASELDIEVVAEGVTNAAQEALLIDAGCKYARGYYFGAPMQAKSVTPLLAGQPDGPTPRTTSVHGDDMLRATTNEHSVKG